MFSVYPRSAPQSLATTDLVNALRDTRCRRSRARTGATILVGGPAGDHDRLHARAVATSCRCSSAVVVLLSALLLLIVFRSLVIPLQAAVMNLLSIGAALGVVVAIFQWGWLGSFFNVKGGADRGVHPGDAVRDRVRAVDGLRGVPRLAHPRGVDAARRRHRRR